MKHGKVVAGILLAAVTGGGVAWGQQAADSAPPASGQYVTREEYEKLLRQQQEMMQELKELKKERDEARAANGAAANGAASANGGGAAGGGAQAGGGNASTTSSDNAAMQDEIDSLKDQVKHLIPGEEKLVIAGDAAFDFVQPEHGNSTFDAGISPLILWSPYKNILVEGAFDASVSTTTDNNSSTSIDLTLADVSFILNDYMIVGGGLFAVPFGQYHNHFDPPWINKFADDPLVFGDGGLAPGSEVGAFIRGAVPLSTTKVTYDAYVTNGPNVITNSADTAGQLNFDDYTDLNNNKAVGGRLGFLPIPQLEMGYSIMVAEVSPSGFSKDLNAVLQAVDLNYNYDAAWARGVFQLRGEWVWSQVDRATFGGGATGFAPVTFNNDRDGGYIQLTYRPTKVENKIIQRLEPGVRWDILTSPTSAPSGNREERWTVGLDYWITPSVVLKGAYEWDDVKVGQNNNMFLLQLGMGL